MLRLLANPVLLGLAAVAALVAYFAPAGAASALVPAAAALAALVALPLAGAILMHRARRDAASLAFAVGPGFRLLLWLLMAAMLALAAAASLPLLVLVARLLADRHHNASPQMLIGAALPVLMLLPVLRLARVVDRTIRAPAETPPGDAVDLPREQHAKLWGVVDQAAAALGCPPPDALRLDASDGAWSYEGAAHPLDRARRPGGRETIVGISMFLLLVADEAELGAVMVHEIRHLHGPDGAALRRARSAAGAIERMVALGVPDMAGRLVFSPLRALAHWWWMRTAPMLCARNRDFELDADRASARVAGPVTAAAILLRIVLLSVAARRVAEDAWSLADGRSDAMALRPALEHAIAARLIAIEPQAALAALLREAERGPFDLYPPTAARLAAMGAPPPEPGWLDLPRPPVLDMLDEPAALAGTLALHLRTLAAASEAAGETASAPA